MSTPLTSPKCDLNASYCKFGCETLLRLLEGFEVNIDGVINNDNVESVHKTRVTSRKLRAALPLFRFCFPKKEFKEMLKEIKKVTNLLGEARDLDVQIIFIENFMKNLSNREKKCIGLLLEGQKKRRESMQSPIVDGLNQLKAANTLVELANFCRKTVNEQAAVAFDPNQVLEKAHWHISFRLDDFLALQKYVHSPNKNLKHHQMRIAAKKLRYTMEFFAPLYIGHLQEEINTAKKYQDILGEKHDNEVWLEYIPKFIKQTTKKRRNLNAAKFNRVMRDFLAYIKEQRKNHYSQFVELWDQDKESSFFENLREKSKAGLTMSEQQIQQVLSGQHVPVGILSDIHANLQALERVFEDAEARGISVFLNAGDSIGYGACPNEVVELLCEKNVYSVIGNYDSEVIEGKSNANGEKKVAWKFARKELTETSSCYLHALPRELRLEVAGKKLLVTHGSPESIEEHIYPDTPTERLKTLAECAKAALIIVGHSHEQFSRQTQGAWFVSPGSVGRPGDGNRQTGYGILNFNPLNIELVRLDYDTQAAADALRKEGLPESFAQMLLRGVALDEITEEDQAREDLSAQNWRKAVQASEEFSKKCWSDTEHYTQVTKLALMFFDGLTKLHGLGDRERCWLECAAVLHDIGLSKSTSAHHKRSAELILNQTELPFTSQERRVIASIARYHRKGSPKQKHYNLQPLSRKTVHKIEVLASLLRVADSLDYTHEASVKSLSFKVAKKRVTVECVSQKKSPLEESVFNKKKDLFEKVFKRKLIQVWNLK